MKPAADKYSLSIAMVTTVTMVGTTFALSSKLLPSRRSQNIATPIVMLPIVVKPKELMHARQLPFVQLVMQGLDRQIKQLHFKRLFLFALFAFCNFHFNYLLSRYLFHNINRRAPRMFNQRRAYFFGTAVLRLFGT